MSKKHTKKHIDHSHGLFGMRFHLKNANELIIFMVWGLFVTVLLLSI